MELLAASPARDPGLRLGSAGLRLAGALQLLGVGGLPACVCTVTAAQMLEPMTEGAFQALAYCQPAESKEKESR